MKGAVNQQNASSEQQRIAAARREAAALANASPAMRRPLGSIPGYTVTREIGRGGMGVIYEARQKEPPRTVALKVMRSRGAVDKHRLRLFRQEVETLARLSHPSIAALYETGRTEAGQHYFAMELVRGVPLIEYVRLQQLPLRGQLSLFCRICSAVQYAHQRGVIHRDLKPSNIVVDGEGNPKILDFGLARITDADEAMRTMFAEAGKVMGTLPYMSPEQARGNPEDIDTRTDVYSLGVILHELASGHLPRPRSEGPNGNGGPRLHESLRGDLRVIIAKALACDPIARYQSATALGEDVDRYLTNQPVLARPATAAYLLRKLIARHVVPATFVAALFVLVSTFAVWMTILYLEAQSARAELVDQKRAQNVALWRAKRAERQLAAALETSALTLMAQGNYAAAEPVLRECLALRRNLVDEDQWWSAYTESLLGGCLTHLGRLAEAEPLLLDSYQYILEGRGPQHERSREAIQRIVDYYVAAGDAEQTHIWQERLKDAATRPAAESPPIPRTP